jgi:hypothetical protein
MQTDDQFAQWAALFVQSVSAVEESPPAVSVVQYTGITAAANDLLRGIDAGGVPAFVSSNLKQIALENGIEVGSTWTPNEIVSAIRAKICV